MMKEPRWDGCLELIESTNQNHQRGEEMLNQTVLPFKLESTSEQLTAYAGLALFGEFCAVMKLSEQVNCHLPATGCFMRSSEKVMSLRPRVTGNLYRSAEVVSENWTEP